MKPEVKIKVIYLHPSYYLRLPSLIQSQKKSQFLSREIENNMQIQYYKLITTLLIL